MSHRTDQGNGAGASGPMISVVVLAVASAHYAPGDLGEVVLILAVFAVMLRWLLRG